MAAQPQCASTNVTQLPFYFYEPYSEAQIGDTHLRSDLNTLARATQGLSGVLRILEASFVETDLDERRPLPRNIKGHLFSAVIALTEQALSTSDHLAKRLIKKET